MRLCVRIYIFCPLKPWLTDVLNFCSTSFLSLNCAFLRKILALVKIKPKSSALKGERALSGQGGGGWLKCYKYGWTFFVQASLPKAQIEAFLYNLTIVHIQQINDPIKVTNLSALAKCSISSACSSNKARSSGVGVNFSI